MNIKTSAAVNEFDNYVKNLRNELDIILTKLSSFDYYEAAASLIVKTIEAGGRIHVTGIGKPQYIAGYFASLLSSIGYPAYFLDGTEATHGSSGQVLKDDIVICISYYGNPIELVQTVKTLKQNEARIIAVTGFDNSEIAQMSDIHLNVYIKREGDSLGKPPRLSMLSTMICLQNLSVILQGYRGLEPSEYLKWHPSGQLGKI